VGRAPLVPKKKAKKGKGSEKLGVVIAKAQELLSEKRSSCGQSYQSVHMMDSLDSQHTGKGTPQHLMSNFVRELRDGGQLFTFDCMIN